MITKISHEFKQNQLTDRQLENQLQTIPNSYSCVALIADPRTNVIHYYINVTSYPILKQRVF